MDVVPDLSSLLLNGVLLRREAVEFGVDDRYLTRAVRGRELARIRQGAYAGHAAWVDGSPAARHRLLTEAALRLYGPGAMISRASAVVHHGGPTYGLDLRTVSLTRPEDSGRTQAGVRHHRGFPLPDDPHLPGGHRVTSIARTVCEATIESGRSEVGVVLASHFLHHNLVAPSDLLSAQRRVGSSAGALVLHVGLGLADRRLESAGEARTWYHLARSDLPTVTPQFSIFDEQGTEIARADFAIEELGVLVEFDGREKYFKFRRPGETMEEYLIRERRRENRLRELTGWEIVRITWADLYNPDEVIARIWAAARRRVAR